MPVENERKFVIKFHEHIEKEFKKAAQEIYKIEQGYLPTGRGITLRIRKQVSDKTKYTLAVKKKVSTFNLEVEKKISEEDYSVLLGSAEIKLQKTRYCVEGWDVDFFKTDEGNTYFGMAEIEYPLDKKSPPKTLNLVDKNLIFQVPGTDSRFSSKKLASVEYTKKLLDELLTKYANSNRRH